MEKIVAKGKLFELVQIEQPDGRTFELARRAPGVRIIIVDREVGRILLTKEYRNELKGYDYRLPGGKVFDTLDEYEVFRQSGDDILSAAEAKAKGEGAEEAGVDIQELRFFSKSTLGATVEWDLYVFEATQWQVHANGQQLEEGEEIEADHWYSFDEAEKMILSGDMQESRIALITLQWLYAQKKK